MELPPTPIHVAPNVEVRSLPTEKFADNFDLNPDLYDEDDSSGPQKQTPTVQENSTRDDTESIATPDAQMDVDDRSNVPKDQFSGQNIEQDPLDIDDINFTVKSVTLPFDVAYESCLEDFSTITHPLSDQQISKLINYTDEQLLKIQRKYIKSQAEDLKYGISDLIRDLSPLVNILWISIINRNRLFGQEDYLIKILGDLEDYIAHYHLFQDAPPVTSLVTKQVIEFFVFFQSLDVKLSCLIDGYSVNIDNIESTQKLCTTQLVRLLPIISRLRILIITKIDHVKSRLLTSSDEDVVDLRNILDVEIGRLFEGVLDRQL